MASTDAIALPLKNTAFRCYFPIWKNDGTLITGWTGSAAVRSLDGGTEAAATNTATVTEIATSSGKGFLDLTAAEMNTNCTVVTVTVTNTSALPTVIVLYPSTSSMIQVNVVTWLGSAVNALISGRVDATVGAMQSAVLNAAAFASNAITTAAINAGAVAQDVLNAVASSYNVALSIGAKINAAGGAADPLASTVPGAYGAGTAGEALGKIAGMKTHTDLITVGSIAVQSPVAANGDTTVYTSRDYSSTDSLALHYTMPYTVLGTDVFNWNINGATVTTGTYIDATHVDVAPTSAQLATLKPGDYDLEIEVIRSTRKLEPIKGKAHILAVVVA